TATRAAVAWVAWTAGERTMRRATSIRLTSGQRTLLRTSFESTNAVASISFPSTVASKRDSPALLPALYIRYPERVAPLTQASIVPLTPGYYSKPEILVFSFCNSIIAMLLVAHHLR